jgi:hypothetical protein
MVRVSNFIASKSNAGQHIDWSNQNTKGVITRRSADAYYVMYVTQPSYNLNITDSAGVANIAVQAIGVSSFGYRVQINSDGSIPTTGNNATQSFYQFSNAANGSSSFGTHNCITAQKGAAISNTSFSVTNTWPFYANHYWAGNTVSNDPNTPAQTGTSHVIVDNYDQFPTGSAGTGGISPDEIRTIAHDYATKGAAFCTSIALCYFIIKQFRWRSIA